MTDRYERNIKRGKLIYFGVLSLIVVGASFGAAKAEDNPLAKIASWYAQSDFSDVGINCLAYQLRVLQRRTAEDYTIPDDKVARYAATICLNAEYQSMLSFARSAERALDKDKTMAKSNKEGVKVFVVLFGKMPIYEVHNLLEKRATNLLKEYPKKSRDASKEAVTESRKVYIASRQKAGWPPTDYSTE